MSLLAAAGVVIVGGLVGLLVFLTVANAYLTLQDQRRRAEASIPAPPARTAREPTDAPEADD